MINKYTTIIEVRPPVYARIEQLTINQWEVFLIRDPKAMSGRKIGLITQISQNGIKYIYVSDNVSGTTDSLTESAKRVVANHVQKEINELTIANYE